MKNPHFSFFGISFVVGRAFCFDFTFDFRPRLFTFDSLPVGGGINLHTEMFRYLPSFRTPREIAINSLFFESVPDREIILHNLSKGFLGDWAPQMPTP